jgi:hypothetical protein
MIDRNKEIELFEAAFLSFFPDGSTEKGLDGQYEKSETQVVFDFWLRCAAVPRFAIDPLVWVKTNYPHGRASDDEEALTPFGKIFAGQFKTDFDSRYDFCAQFPLNDDFAASTTLEKCKIAAEYRYRELMMQGISLVPQTAVFANEMSEQDKEFKRQWERLLLLQKQNCLVEPPYDYLSAPSEKPDMSMSDIENQLQAVVPDSPQTDFAFIESEREKFLAYHKPKFGDLLNLRYLTHKYYGAFFNNSVQHDFEVWLACASIPRPVPAGQLQSDQEKINLLESQLRTKSDELKTIGRILKLPEVEVVTPKFVFDIIQWIKFYERKSKNNDPAETAQTAQPIGQAWGIWAEKPEGGSGFINQDRLIFPFSEDEIDRHIIELKKNSILNWHYEKRPLYIYDAQQQAQAPAAPQMQPNT